MSGVGSVWNLVTKSGGNQFHGRVERDLHQRRPWPSGEQRRRPARSQGLSNADSVVWFSDFTGDLGGRLIPDKLWFYTAYRRRQNERTAAGEVLFADPSCGCVTDNTPYVAPDKQDNYTEKLTYQPNAKYQLVGLFAHDISVNNGGVETARAPALHAVRVRHLEVYDPAHSSASSVRAQAQSDAERRTDASHYTFELKIRRATRRRRPGSTATRITSAAAASVRPRTTRCTSTHIARHDAGDADLPAARQPSRRHAPVPVGGGSRVAGGGGTSPNHPAGNYQITYDVVGGVAASAG